MSMQSPERCPRVIVHDPSTMGTLRYPIEGVMPWLDLSRGIVAVDTFDPAVPLFDPVRRIPGVNCTDGLLHQIATAGIELLVIEPGQELPSLSREQFFLGAAMQQGSEAVEGVIARLRPTE